MRNNAFVQPDAAEHAGAAAQTALRQGAEGILIHGFNTCKHRSVNSVV